MAKVCLRDEKNAREIWLIVQQFQTHPTLISLHISCSPQSIVRDKHAIMFLTRDTEAAHESFCDKMLLTSTVTQFPDAPAHRNEKFPPRVATNKHRTAPPGKRRKIIQRWNSSQISFVCCALLSRYPTSGPYPEPHHQALMKKKQQRRHSAMSVENLIHFPHNFPFHGWYLRLDFFHSPLPSFITKRTIFSFVLNEGKFIYLLSSWGR